MKRGARNGWIAGAVAAGWAAAAGLSWWSGRETPVEADPPEPGWISVAAPAGSPATRDWAHFLACSGLAGDPALMRATLLLNDGGDEAVWRRAAGQDVVVRVALSPLPGDPGPNAERILGEAPRAVADCGAAE